MPGQELGPGAAAGDQAVQRRGTGAERRGTGEVILGRGSSIASFPLFGYDLGDYEELFEEKATLFAELLKAAR